MTKTKIICWILIILLALQLVTAIGIRPAKTSLIFEEGRDYVKTFWLVNDEERGITARIGIEGELSQYITLNTEEVTLRSDDGAKPIEFEIHLPEEVPPGITNGKIVVEESVLAEGNNVVSSRIVLKHKIELQGEYPDKFVKAKLNFHDQGEYISFVSEVENLGKTDISTIQTKFFVNDQEETHHILETDETSLARKENKLLSTTLERDLFELGEFEVSAVTEFDGHQIEVVKDLLVGQPDVEITYFDKFFIARKINQYSIDLLNKWNREIKNVFVDVEVKKDDQKVDEFRTKSVDVEGEMTKRINDYFDAKDKGPGKYSFEMVVNFWNLIRTEQRMQRFEADLVSEDQAIERTPPTGGATSTGEETSADSSSFSLTSTLFWVLLGMIIGAFGFYVLWRYVHRNQYEGGEGGAL